MKSKLLLIFMFVGVLVFAALDSSEPGWIVPQYPEGEEPTVITDDYLPQKTEVIPLHSILKIHKIYTINPF